MLFILQLTLGLGGEKYKEENRTFKKFLSLSFSTSEERRNMKGVETKH